MSVVPQIWLEPIEHDEELYRELEEEIDGCTELNPTRRNRVKKFLKEYGVYHIAEMDYPLREEYKRYLEKNETVICHISCLNAFDRIKLHSMKQELQTLAGKQKYALRYTGEILFLPYYPQIEIAEEFQNARDKESLVWDFKAAGSERMKRQIFDVLCKTVSDYDGWFRKDKLSALKVLYEFCLREAVEDLETMAMTETSHFKNYLDTSMTSTRLLSSNGIMDYARKIVFLQADEIHWQANVWYLERFHFARERLNPSKPVESISFVEVTNVKNREVLKKYMKYAFGITDLSISSLRSKFLEIRRMLEHFNEEEEAVYELPACRIDNYIKMLSEKDTTEKTFNGQLFNIMHFYNFLMVRGYIKKIPFHYEYYQKKVLPIHNDRSVREEVCDEILTKLYRFPEQLRLMFLHLWSIGLRCSEVCTLEGDAYEWKDGDAWIKVYQIKMRTYKRIPIPEALYRLMQIYITKYQIKPGEYLFKNKKGGAYCYATFRMQMLKCCEENQIENGNYLFQSHDYRHRLATEYYDGGASIQAVRDYLGHDCEDMTRQYIDYMPRKLERASDEFFNGSGHSLAAELMKGGGTDGK